MVSLALDTPRLRPHPSRPREPQFLQACGGLAVPELGAAVPTVGGLLGGRILAGLASPSWTSRSASGRQLHSKFTPFFPPHPHPRASRSRPCSGPMSAQGCSAQKLAIRGQGTECEAVAQRSEIPAVSELEAFAALNFANEISPDAHPFRPEFFPCAQRGSRGLKALAREPLWFRTKPPLSSPPPEL